MKLSICMMVKNEEKNLPRCLEKLSPLIESELAELILVDTGSEDKSIEIAKQYTSKVYLHKWNKNFSEMRNISISYAKGDWIFILDADERLDDVEKLITLMSSKEIEKYNTVIVQVKNLYYPNDESKYNLITSPRLFKNDGQFRYEGAVHNQPIFKGPNLSVDINLTHFGYITTDKKLMERKYKRTTELLKWELEKDPKNLYYIYQLGVSYDMHGNHKIALDEFREAYRLLKNRSIEEKKTYAYIYASYARIAYTNNQYKETLKVSREALSLKKDYIDLYYLIGISETQLGNDREANKFLIKYLDLVNKYNELEISKDMSIIMYHIDDKSKSTVYYLLTKYYLGIEKYNDAYKFYVNITSINEKIFSSINLLIPLKKYSELRTVYDDLTLVKDKNSFLCTLEEKANELEENEKTKLFYEFSLNEDVYGLFNKIRTATNTDEKLSLTKLFFKEVDLNKVPLFYNQIFKNVKENFKLMIGVLKKIELWNLRGIVKYLVEEHDFRDVFENYILKDNNSSQDIEEAKVFISIANVLLLLHLEENNKISEKYLIIFKVYLNMGDIFVQGLYRVDKAESIYKNINNPEDRFFMIMHIINKLVKESNKKSAVKYMIEAVNIYEPMAKYIDHYKNEIFNLQDEKIVQAKNREFEEYKLKVKENINNLINSGQLEESKELINKYEEVVKEDIDIYSMKAIIAIMEGRIDEGENILKNGLKIDANNADLLINLSFIQSQNNNTSIALETYSKAKLFNPNINVKVSDIITNLQPTDNKKLKVLNGTIEIANQMSTLTKGLRNLGIDAKSLNYYPNYLGYKCDYVLDVNSFKDINQLNTKTKNLAAKLISENDVFHFHFGSSLTLNYSDLPILKELDKKVFMQHWGSDVRMYSQAKKLNKFVKVKDMNEDGIKNKLDFLSKYISKCIVSDYELFEYVKNVYDNVYLVNQSIDLEKYKVSQTKNEKLLIVHAPSSPEIKGTKYILNAIEKLKQTYDFDFVLVQGMAHEEAKKIYRKADLIIDQILCGSYGLFTIEAMAMGKPVICWISDFMKEKYSKELPIISANPDNIKEKIEYAIKNKDMLKEIGIQGRKYVEKYHDMNKIAKEMAKIYKY